jgi:tRNA G18 (ribose-2'-O)-methylase SpoU
MEQGYEVWAVEQAQGSTFLPNFAPSPQGKYAFIFGNEVHGVEQTLIDQCGRCLEIPQFGTKHSFNVAVSAGIVLWDALSKWHYKT